MKTTADLRAEAERRFLTDAEFHARVYLTVRIIGEVRRLDDDALALATTAAAVAAHLSDTGIEQFAGTVPPTPIIAPR